MKSKAYYFDHEKLDVYQAALAFVILTNEILENIPRGKSYLVDQLQRASSSILLNIAEGAGEFSVNEKIRFYRMARRSATECAGVLAIIQCFELINTESQNKGRELLLRIVSMLSKMIQVNGNGSGKESGNGSGMESGNRSVTQAQAQTLRNGSGKESGNGSGKESGNRSVTQAQAQTFTERIRKGIGERIGNASASANVHGTDQERNRGTGR